MRSKETKLVPYHLKEMGNASGEILSRTFQFYTQYDVPLSEPMGPFPTNIDVKLQQGNDWNELVYLPESVVKKARSLEEYAIVLKTTFLGKSLSGAEFGAQSSLLLLLPPAAFSKDIPVNQAVAQPTNPSLQWNSSIGAIDYEYCFDTFNNNSCDTDWTGTYWLGTYDTNAALQDLPSGTTFYWQVRANNTAGTTYANDGAWWSFTTSCNTSLITVTNTNDSSAGSLRQAIADICPGGKINFDASLSGQTIMLNSTLLIYKDLTIDGSALASRVKISGNNSATVFHVFDFTVTLNSLIITKGNSGSGAGGGIQTSGTLNIENSVISENSGGFGGGIQNIGTLSVTNSTFSDNLAFEGGGILNSGLLTIANSTFSSNMAKNGGGIVNNGGTLTITNSILSGNSTTSVTNIYGNGGGIYNYGVLTVTNTAFSGNSTGRTGGGIFTGHGTLNILSSTFSGNSSYYGGGVFIGAGDAEITNGTFSANSAVQGGGVYNDVSSLTLTSSTFSGNSGTYGGGIYNAGVLHYMNNILANSISGGDCYNEEGTGEIFTNVNNIVETNASSSNACGTPALTSDPKLGFLANNGGLTQTMALLAGSPAINAGKDANCPATDQRGVARPQGSHCDMGAYEYQKKSRNDTTGVYRPSNGALYLKNSNTTGVADVSINYGIPGDKPVVGDWDGDGEVTIGVYRNGVFYLRNSNSIGIAEIYFAFGLPGDQPIAGDWDGDGIDTIGVYRSSNFTFYLRNKNSTGTPDLRFSLGMPGDVGIAGDWNGDGLDTTGVFRPSNGALYLKNINATGVADIAIHYGIPGDKPVTGDWNNDGMDTIGVYRNGVFYLRNSNTVGIADLYFALGIPGDLPIAGDWDGDQ